MVRWKLKQVIAEKKLSMKQVAALSGVLCRNPHQDSTVRTLSKLADTLDVAYAELIESERL